MTTTGLITLPLAHVRGVIDKNIYPIVGNITEGFLLIYYFGKLLLKLYTSNTFLLTTIAAYKYIPQSSWEEATWRQIALMHINSWSLDIAKLPLTHVHHRLSYGSKQKDNNTPHIPKFYAKIFRSEISHNIHSWWPLLYLLVILCISIALQCLESNEHCLHKRISVLNVCRWVSLWLACGRDSPHIWIRWCQPTYGPRETFSFPPASYAVL